jgi:hypothetical protein
MTNTMLARAEDAQSVRAKSANVGHCNYVQSVYSLCLGHRLFLFFSEGYHESIYN